MQKPEVFHYCEEQRTANREKPDWNRNTCLERSQGILTRRLLSAVEVERTFWDGAVLKSIWWAVNKSKAHWNTWKITRPHIALGLMQSTHVQVVEMIAAVEPLRIRFFMLNQRYLTNVLAKPSVNVTKLFNPYNLKKYSILASFDLQPKQSVYSFQLDFTLLHVLKVIEEVQDDLLNIHRENISTTVRGVIASVMSNYDLESIIFTDGSRSIEGTGFGVFHAEKHGLRSDSM
jgi:hypothetical protein